MRAPPSPPVSPGHLDPAPGAGLSAQSDLDRARAVAAHLAADTRGRSGEPIFDHGLGTLSILQSLRVDLPTQLASLLFGLGDRMPLEAVAESFGEEVRTLVAGMRQLLRLKDLTTLSGAQGSQGQLETLRRMTLAMATDIRVVLLRLASRLQTLRYHAAVKVPPDDAVPRETLEVLAPLANRLGLGQLKWELEDLAFRFVEPTLYKSIAVQLEERRVQREDFVRDAIRRLESALAEQGIRGEVSGRPKHIHSIWNKMRSKGLSFAEVQDLRAFRVLVEDVKECYTVLGIVHQIWPPVPREFDDYISRPKPNGYQSLHTVVTADDGRPLEIQIRTREMHRRAEFGVASHWRYKESSTGLAGSPAGGDAKRGSARTALDGQEARIEWMRQLLMWQQELGATLGGHLSTAAGAEGELIYLLTPQARVVELPAGSTPVDFAYHVHTLLGHRCRGARVDGHMVPLNTALHNGQTVEIIAARTGGGPDGPSRDWLNPQLGYVRSARARAKVRQWFNALDAERDAADGRQRIERVLQREGRTALALDELARRLKLDGPEQLFLAVAREEIGPRQLEEAVRAEADGGRVGDTARALAGARQADAEALQRVARASRASAARGTGVLVVGADFLLTQLGKCCRPAPPDPIIGFVTRGRGVSVHRQGCPSFVQMARRAPERVLDADWGDTSATPRLEGRSSTQVYPVDVVLRARDRQGLLRDISDVFARDRLNVIGVHTVSRDAVAQMRFTVEVPNIAALNRTLAAVEQIEGVLQCRRV